MKQDLLPRLSYLAKTAGGGSGDSARKRSPSRTPRHTLTILLPGVYRYLSRIWIFSGDNAVVFNPNRAEDAATIHGQPNDKKTFSLPPGNYTVRLVIDGQFTDKAIVLDRDKICATGSESHEKRGHGAVDEHLDIPSLYSSVPLKTDTPYASTFDYYVDAALKASAAPTLGTGQNAPHSGLFIFLRYPSAAVFREKFHGRPYWKSFALYDRQWALVTRFPKGAISDGENGSLGFSARLAPGLYFLEYDGPDKRVVPIYVFENWYTQLFMTLGAEPLFGSIKIFINGMPGFNPGDTNYLFTDVCLSKIQNGDYTIDRQLLDIIAGEKFTSPMLGLLGAYIYLNGKDTSHDHLFQAIVRNLRERILIDSVNSQDVYALNFLSYARWGRVLDEEVTPNTKNTPMLRIAYDTLRQAASKYDWVIPAGTLNDRIAECQYFDSPFNTFRSFYPDIQYLHLEEEHRTVAPLNPWIARFGPPRDTRGDQTIKALLARPPAQEDTRAGIRIDTPIFKHFPHFKYGMGLNDLGGGGAFLTGGDFGLGHTYGPDPSAESAFTSRLEGLLKTPQEMGRYGATITRMILDDKSLSTDAIAGRLQLPITTVNRIREQWNLFLEGPPPPAREQDILRDTV